MGRLTDDMTRLRNETDALHEARETFVEDLKQDVAEMKAGFQGTHAEMAGKMKTDLSAFVSSLASSVSEMKAGFHNACVEMAKTTKSERMEFLSDLEQAVADLKREVAELQEGFAADIAGAHRAWFEPSPAEHRAREEANRQAERGERAQPAARRAGKTKKSTAR